jgi:ABC-2 type transport system ATP-binding protein
MAEMGRTADQVIVVAKGRLVANMPIDEFTSKNSRRSVLVRSPQLDDLRTLLQGAGASTSDESDGSISVLGLSADAIGDLAARHSLVLHELTPQSGTLEAFVESTEGNIEYQVRSITSENNPRKETS